MKYLKGLIATTAVPVFNSCDPCANPVNLCPDENDRDSERQFRIVRKTDKTDMLFGSTRVFNANEIKVYSLKGADTTFLYASPIKVGMFLYDSVFLIRFKPLPDVANMRFGNGDIDTLNITERNQKNKCCPDIIYITHFDYNRVRVKDDWLVRELEK